MRSIRSRSSALSIVLGAVTATLLVGVALLPSPAQGTFAAPAASAGAHAERAKAASVLEELDLDEHDHSHGFELHYFDDDVPAAGGGRVVRASDDITSFRPEDSSVSVEEAENLNLRDVFEQLGPEAAQWYQHVLALADPFMEGRAPGTKGIEIAAQYIEWNMQQIGLKPAFQDTTVESTDKAWNTFRQPFTFTYMGQPVQVKKAEVEVGGAKRETLKEGEDFVVLGNSASDEVTGPISFVGYAIEDGPNSYSSFGANDDLTGRIALVLRYEPIGKDGKSRWDDERFSQHAALRNKLMACVERGAKGIIVVNPPGAVDAAEGLETLESSSRFRPRMQVPVIQLSEIAADLLVEAVDAQHRNLHTLSQLADEGRITVEHFTDDMPVRIATEVVQGRLATDNVAGVLEGKGDLADRWIVIGGHYDHLGYGYTGVRKRSQIGLVHPGADDNASGTAAILLLANRIANYYEGAPEDASLRSILFIAFSAEEAGLHGSRYFVEHPSMPMESIDIMLNFDMVGRLRNDELSVSGTGTAKEFDELLKPHFEASGLTIKASPGGRGPSDHSNFFGKGVPVLFPFTGLHEEYHTADDKGFTVNPAGAMKVIDLVEAIALEMVSRPDSLTFVRDTTPEAGPPRGDNRVRLGIMPAYGAEIDTGVMIEVVSPGTSAEKAGIKPGDILLTWNDDVLVDGQALMEKLSQANPGDKVMIKVQRGSDTLTLEVTLQASESTR
jgi:aminopeptidase YwaD